ncbi:hypothetical protein AgCh_023051 [Apium graveolens]
MAYKATARKKFGMGRGPNHVPKAPTNPDDRPLIRIRPPRESNLNTDQRLGKHLEEPVICLTQEGQHLMQGEKEKGKEHEQECVAHTKDNLSKDRKKALHNDGVDHENAMEHMHEYSPWWCTTDIWEEMCNQWRDEKWLKKRKTASSNRAGGGEKAKGTYKGGSISQLQHIANKEAQSQGLINWVDVYVKTRDGLPEAVAIAEDYRRLFDERYPEGTECPYFDQDLWDTASKMKKNYVKGQGQRRRPSICGSSFSTQSSQSSSQPTVHTLADCVRAIYRDPELLRILGGHLGALDPEDLARAVADMNASNQGDSSKIFVADPVAATLVFDIAVLTQLSDGLGR